MTDLVLGVNDHGPTLLDLRIQLDKKCETNLPSMNMLPIKSNEGGKKKKKEEHEPHNRSRAQKH
jgi:hypothetical protein